MLGSMSRAIGGQGRRAMSGSALTRGGMYNWRVAAILNALERAGKAEGPLEIADLTALGHLDQYHYLGTEACDHAATSICTGSESVCAICVLLVGDWVTFGSLLPLCHPTFFGVCPPLLSNSQKKMW